MEIYEAVVALPMPHVMAATARLRGDLRRQVLDENTLVLPDWSSFLVAPPIEKFDDEGLVVFEYHATVQCDSWGAFLTSPSTVGQCP